MNTKTTTITARVAPNVKAEADAMFTRLGLNTSEAISIFLHKALSYGGLPFDVTEHKIPNATTLAAFEETEAMIRGEIPKPPYMTCEDFFAEMEREIANEA